MGTIYCPPSNHPELHSREVKCCWGCDRCPKEHNFRLGKGDYCPDCRREMIKAGLIWSEYYQNYVKPDLAARVSDNPLRGLGQQLTLTLKAEDEGLRPEE